MFLMIANQTKKFFHKIDTESTLMLSISMMIISISTKLIGLVNQVLLINKLGTSSTDFAIYNIASIIPEFLSSVIFLGSITAAVIPTLNSVRARKGDTEFTKVFQDGLRFLSFIYVVLAVIIIIFIPLFLPALLGERTFSTDDISKVILYTRLLLIPQIILGISAYFMAGLQTLYKFIVPQLTGLIYNLGILIGIVLFLNNFNNLIALFLGSLIASLLHLTIQLPQIKEEKLLQKIHNESFEKISHFKTKFKSFIGLTSETLSMAKLGIPRMLGVASNQVLFSAEKLIVQNISVNAVNQLRGASSLVNIPFSMIVYTFSIVALSKMSREFANGHMQKVKEVFLTLFSQVMYLSIPVAAILIVLRVPLVRMTYGMYPSNPLPWIDTLSIAWIIMFYAVGLIFVIANTLFSQLFFATKRTLLPFLINLFIVFFGILLAIGFTNFFSHSDTLVFSSINWDLSNFGKSLHVTSEGNPGLAAIGGVGLASSLVNFFAFFIFLYFINKKIFVLGKKEFWITLVNKFSTGVLMTFSMFWVSKFYEVSYATETVWELLISTSITMIVGLLIYFVSGYFFRIEETYYLTNKLKRLLKL
ncbi:hypothetical protein IPJ91_00895 [bacterium]|nr:MAG: hypothetical protein IPJ91_00895 [bacterium]